MKTLAMETAGITMINGSMDAAVGNELAVWMCNTHKGGYERDGGQQPGEGDDSKPQWITTKVEKKLVEPRTFQAQRGHRVRMGDVI